MIDSSHFGILARADGGASWVEKRSLVKRVALLLQGGWVPGECTMNRGLRWRESVSVMFVEGLSMSDFASWRECCHFTSAKDVYQGYLARGPMGSSICFDDRRLDGSASVECA